MGPTTLTNKSDVLDERRHERAGEFLHVTPETVDANPANATTEFRIPQTGEKPVLGNFVPAPAEPYVEETNNGAARVRAAEALKNAAELVERGYQDEVKHAGGAVGTIRMTFYNSRENAE